MISFSEAQLLAWISPILWPFIRTLALFAGMPVFSQRQVPARVRIGLALFISVAAQPSLPAMPVIPLDSLPQLLAVTGQQLLIGLSMGFAVRVVFAALEFAGELIGLQMGLNFAGFFDPSTGEPRALINGVCGATQCGGNPQGAPRHCSGCKLGSWDYTLVQELAN